MFVFFGRLIFDQLLDVFWYAAVVVQSLFLYTAVNIVCDANCPVSFSRQLAIALHLFSVLYRTLAYKDLLVQIVTSEIRQKKRKIERGSRRNVKP